jgi:predicted nuclease with TOPRIM domain
MKKIVSFCIVAMMFATSCVSRSDYESAQYWSDYWENAFNKLNKENQQLIKDYNQLVDEYNELNSRINRARSAVDDLENHFDSFRDGYWYDADDIESDIRNVRSKLNGW